MIHVRIKFHGRNICNHIWPQSISVYFAAQGKNKSQTTKGSCCAEVTASTFETSLDWVTTPLARTIFIISLARHGLYSLLQKRLPSFTPLQPEAWQHWVITSNNWFLFPGVRLVTWMPNSLPLLTTLLNHISALIFSSAFSSDSKSGLFLLKQKMYSWQAECMHRSNTAYQSTVFLSSMWECCLPPKKPTFWSWSRTNPKLIFKRNAATVPKSSLTQNPYESIKYVRPMICSLVWWANVHPHLLDGLKQCC